MPAVKQKIVKHFIYALKDPESLEVFYIGKTCFLKERLCGHVNGPASKEKAVWIENIKSKGLRPIIEVLEVCDKLNWREREVYHIEEGFRVGLPLSNKMAKANGREMIGDGTRKTEVVKIDKHVMDKVREFCKMTGMSISRFFEIAAIEKLNKK